MKLAPMALRNVRRNRRRSVLSAVAVAVAALIATMVFSMLEGMKADITHNAVHYETGELRLRHRDFDRYEYLQPVQYAVDDATAVIATLRTVAGVGPISPRISVVAAVFRGERRIGTRGVGIDLALERRFQDIDRVVAAGRLPRPGAAEALLGVRLARELGVGVGDTVTFLTQTRLRTSNAFSVQVVGLASFGTAAMDRTTFWLPLDVAARFMRMDGAVSEVLIKRADSAVVLPELRRRVDEALTAVGRTEIAGALWTEVSGGYAYLQFAESIYFFIVLFFLLLGSTVIINTTMMTIHERRREIGTLAALGMRPRELVRLFFAEGAFLGMGGAFLGVTVGVAIILPFQRYGFNFGSAMDLADMDISTVVYPVLNLRSTVGVFFYAVAVQLAATFLPARRAAKLIPVDALRR